MDQGWHHTATSLKQYTGSGDVVPLEDWLPSVHEPLVHSMVAHTSQFLGNKCRQAAVQSL